MNDYPDEHLVRTLLCLEKELDVILIIELIGLFVPDSFIFWDPCASSEIGGGGSARFFIVNLRSSFLKRKKLNLIVQVIHLV